jgi:type I restriction enzyme, S subunit
MTELPHGWVETTLAQLANEVRGSEAPGAGTMYELYSVPTFPTRKPEVLDGSEIGSSKRPVQPGDVLLCKINPRINRVWTVGEPLEPGRRQIASTEYLVLRTRIPDLSRYLVWYLRSPRFREWIKLSVEGATGSHTRAKSGPILRQRVPLAPLDEQRRIVAAIEEQSSRLEAASASIGEASRRLERLSEAVLESLIDKAEWPRSAVADAAQLVTDGDHNPPPRVASGIPHLTAKNIKRGRIVLDGCSFVSEQGYEQTRKRYEPRRGDVIVTCVGTIGETAVVPPDLQFSADRNLAAIRVLPDVDPAYVSYALSSPNQRRAMFSASGSTAQPHLYLRDLRGLTIPLPELGEQRHAASEVERLLSIIDVMKAETTRTLLRVSALRRAILEGAFRGELVAQDPSDEPASVLLGRIEAGPASAVPLRRRRTVSA